MFSVTGVLAILAVSLVVVLATGFTPARSRLLDGGAWLADAENMPHASGPNAAVDAAVQKCPDVTDCRWVQRDGLAYLLQSRSGQVHRLDTATRAFDEQGVSIGREARLLVGTGRVYSIDRATGAVTSRDVVSLAPRGDATAVEGGAGDAIVDRSGVLWVVEIGTGNLIGIDDTSVLSRISIGGNGAELTMGSIDDTPVILDRGSATITPIDDRGRAGRRVTLTELDARRTVLGRDLPSGPLFAIERGSGRLTRIDLSTGATTDVGQIDIGDQVTALHVVGRSAFAVQGDLGVVRWFSMDDRVEHDPIGDASETFVKDGYLFANDARAREAHLAGPDTDPQPILKRRDDIPKFDVKPEQNSYNPTPISVTTTTRVEQVSSPTSSTMAPSTSSSSTTSTTTPGTSTTLPAADVPPPAPTNVTAQGDDGKATVRWNSTATMVEHFEIEPDGSATSFDKQTAAGSVCAGGDCDITITRLTNGSTYRFVIYAVDAKGTRSAPSSPSNPVLVDAGLPGTAGTPTAKGRPNGVVEVSWTPAGEGAGGRPISGYTVTALDEAKQPLPAQATAGASATTATVSGLRDGQRYYFRVVATNDAGKDGSPSDSQNPAAPFGRPTAVTVTASSELGCGNAAENPTTWPVSWEAYPFEADSSTKQYAVTVDGQPQPASTGSSLSATVLAGHQGTVSVAAENDAGLGPTSTATVTCYLEDAAGQLTFDPPVVQTGTVNFTFASTSAPGAPCCYHRISDPNIRVTGPNGTGAPVATIPVPSQYQPGARSGPHVLPTDTMAPGTYDVIIQSPSGQLAVTSFDVAAPPGPFREPVPNQPERPKTPAVTDTAIIVPRGDRTRTVSASRRNES